MVMRPNPTGTGRGGRWRLPVIAAQLALCLSTAGCGGQPDADDEAVLDTLALLDRELDLAMSGDSVLAELVDEAPGEGARAEQPARRSTAAQPPPPPAPRPPAPQAERRDDPAPVADEERPESADSGPVGPRYEQRRVGGGVTFAVILNQELGTRHNRVGDLFSAALERPLTDGGVVVAPAGALVVGEVSAVQASGSHGKPAVINLQIHEVSFDGESYPIAASIIQANPETRSRTSTGEKAAKIGGAAVAGAILGSVIGGDALGTIIGTAVGGAAGTAIVLGTDDVDAVLPKGSRLVLRLDAPLEVRVAVSGP